MTITNAVIGDWAILAAVASEDAGVCVFFIQLFNVQKAHEVCLGLSLFHVHVQPEKPFY